MLSLWIVISNSVGEGYVLLRRFRDLWIPIRRKRYDYFLIRNMVFTLKIGCFVDERFFTENWSIGWIAGQHLRTFSWNIWTLCLNLFSLHFCLFHSINFYLTSSQLWIRDHSYTSTILVDLLAQTKLLLDWLSSLLVGLINKTRTPADTTAFRVYFIHHILRSLKRSLHLDWERLRQLGENYWSLRYI